MKKITCISLVLILLVSLLAISCDNSVTKKSEETKKEELDEAKAPVVGASVAANIDQIYKTLQKVIAADNQESTSYSKNESLKLESGKKETFSLLSADEKQKYENPDKVTSDELESSVSVKARTYEYISVNTGLSKKVDAKGEYHLLRSSLSLVYKFGGEAGEEKIDADLTKDNPLSSFTNTAVIKEIQWLLKNSYTSDDKTISFNASLLPKFVQLSKDYLPLFTYETDFGTEDKDRGKISVSFTLDSNNANDLIITLENLKITLGDEVLLQTEKDDSIIVTLHDFDMDCQIQKSKDDSGNDLYVFKFSTDTIRGSANAEFDNLLIKVGSTVFTLNGKASYNFGDGISSADVVLGFENSFAPLEAGIRFSGNLKQLLASEDKISAVYDCIEITSLKVGTTEYDTTSVNRVFKSENIKRAILEYFKKK